jgi:long-chain acyl-CoA synthetase
MSMPGKSRVGYVGSCYDDVECRIASDGEIQVKTPGKMMGYFKSPEATAETITEDGWVRTGDKGSLDDTNRLRITGRTKEIFKTSKGKYVAPAPIENELISNQFVELACVGGKSQPQPFAIIQLSEAPKKKALSNASERDALGKELEALLTTVNPKLDGHEQLQFLVVVENDWLPENGFLTPTQKIKRPTIEDAYDSKVDGWYGQKKKVVWDGFQ